MRPLYFYRFVFFVLIFAVLAGPQADLQPAEGKSDAAQTMVIARGNKPCVYIAISADSIAAEKTAVQELALYLNKITKASFEVVEEQKLPKDTPAIYVGGTAFACSQGIDIKELAAEESIIRTADGSLIVTGGRSRGTLYGVYMFLEDILGCRWYTPWVEKIPDMPTCIIKQLDIRTRPAFAVRDSTTWMPERTWTDEEKRQWYVFTVRNRLNGPRFGKNIWWKWKALHVPELIPGGDAFGAGAGLRRGAPHTFRLDFPARKYFKEHPEWFSMRNGKRVTPEGGTQNHLCLTNKELRRAYIEKLKGYMKENPRLNIYSVAQNDGGKRSVCDCPECTAFARETSWTDLHLDFINELADGVREDFPHNRILTLAYAYSTEPPKKVKARDNVIVNATLFLSSRVILSQGEKRYRRLAGWIKSCKNVWVWDYQDAFGPWYPFLAPQYFLMQEQYSMANKMGITGVFGENYIGRQFYIVPEFYQMRLWLFAKLLQEPDQDIFALIHDFMQGYYGKGGEYLYEYVRMQYERLSLWPQRMVDLSFINRMQTLYDSAEKAVQDEPDILNRVIDARIWADITTLFFRAKLSREFVQGKHNLEDYPYKSDMLRQRIIDRLTRTKDPFWHVRALDSRNRQLPRTALIDFTKAFINKLAVVNDYAPLPEAFANLNHEQIIDIPGYHLHRNHHDKKVELVVDPDSVFGLVSARFTADELPLKIGVYKKEEVKEEDIQLEIESQDIPGSGYHLYELGRITISPEKSLFWFTGSWKIQKRLTMFYDPVNPEQEWDVYVSVKLDGPAYPFGDPNRRNGAYIERVILVKHE